jgi:tRNA U38,U39,U40 pseudouridine synthase TruA
LFFHLKNYIKYIHRRIIFEIDIVKADDLSPIQNYDSRGEMLFLKIRGNSFVWHQVNNTQINFPNF